MAARWTQSTLSSRLHCWQLAMLSSLLMSAAQVNICTPICPTSMLQADASSERFSQHCLQTYDCARRYCCKERPAGIQMWLCVLPGASYGQWRMPWAPAEREDSIQVIDWIVQQNWSNEQVCQLAIILDSRVTSLVQHCSFGLSVCTISSPATPRYIVQSRV